MVFVAPFSLMPRILSGRGDELSGKSTWQQVCDLVGTLPVPHTQAAFMLCDPGFGNKHRRDLTLKQTALCSYLGLVGTDSGATPPFDAAPTEGQGPMCLSAWSRVELALPSGTEGLFSEWKKLPQPVSLTAADQVVMKWQVREAPPLFSGAVGVMNRATCVNGMAGGMTAKLHPRFDGVNSSYGIVSGLDLKLVCRGGQHWNCGPSQEFPRLLPLLEYCCYLHKTNWW